MNDDELYFKIAFSALKGVTPVIGWQLLQLVGSERRFFELPHSTLQSLLSPAGFKMTEEKRREALGEAAATMQFNDRHQVKTLYFDDRQEYPRRLIEIDDAPTRLFCLGDMPDDDCRFVSIVGTRHATNYGAQFINALIEQIAQAVPDCVVVSGLAFGIDIMAHRAALRNGLKTVAVVAHGLDTIYPAQHRNDAAEIINSGGAILSEYSPGSAVHRGYFLARNRIVAGLSDATVIVESAKKGGAMVTGRLASEYNRQLFAVPGRTTDPYSAGCNSLIAHDRATMLRSCDDLLSTMGWESRNEGQQQELFPKLTAEQQTVVDLLRKSGDCHIDAIASALGIKIHEASALLIEMDFDGIVATLPGSRYSLLI